VIVQHPQRAGCNRWQRGVPGITGGSTPIPSDVGALRQITQHITLVVVGHIDGSCLSHGQTECPRTDQRRWPEVSL
jgi:hypothetical protein